MGTRRGLSPAVQPGVSSPAVCGGAATADLGVRWARSCFLQGRPRVSAACGDTSLLPGLADREPGCSQAWAPRQVQRSGVPGEGRVTRQTLEAQGTAGSELSAPESRLEMEACVQAADGHVPRVHTQEGRAELGSYKTSVNPGNPGLGLASAPQAEGDNWPPSPQLGG